MLVTVECPEYNIVIHLNLSVVLKYDLDKDRETFVKLEQILIDDISIVKK